jgi:tellurite resistance protein
MSFLRKMFSGKVKSEDPRRFLVEAMLGAMEADGEVTGEEMEVLQNNLEGHDLFEGLLPEETARMIDLAADAIRKSGGGGKRLDAIAKGLPNRSHRMAAYTLACEICVSDAELPESEINYLDALQSALGLSDDESREIFEAARSDSGLLTLEEKASKMRDIMPSFVDCMALMASADEEVHFEELMGIRAVLRNIPDMAVLSSDELDQAIEASLERVKGKSIDSELKEIGKKIDNPADRYWTTVYMMIVALADGKTDWREVAFLKQVEEVFGLNDHQMDQAMETASLFPAVELGGDAPA